MIDVIFEVPLPPKGKGRPRCTCRKKGNKVIPQLYTPSDTRKWESMFADLAANAFPEKIIDEPIRIDAVMVMQRPKRLETRYAPEGLIYAPVKPDVNNVLGAILDALKAFWRDDALVVFSKAIKVYAHKGCRAKIQVRIRSANIFEPGDQVTREFPIAPYGVPLYLAPEFPVEEESE